MVARGLPRVPSGGSPMSSVGRGGREPAIGAAGQLPAALMDRPMMRPAQQDQVGQVGRATIQPMPQMMGVTPGQRPITTREDTTPVPHRQGGALGRLHHPGAAADVQGLTAGPAQGRRQPGHGRPQLLLQPPGPPGPALILGSWSTLGSWSARQPSGSMVGWRLTSTRVTAPSQASRRHAAGANGPAHPASPPRPPGWPRRLSRSTVTSSWGRTPPALGNPPPSNTRRANSVRASAVRWPPLRPSPAPAGRARGSRAASRVVPASGSSSPSTATMPSKVGDNHTPRRP